MQDLLACSAGLFRGMRGGGRERGVRGEYHLIKMDFCDTFISQF